MQEICFKIFNCFLENRLNLFIYWQSKGYKYFFLEEENLINKLKNVETQDLAFRYLMSLYKERLYWHIRQIVKVHADVDDILQNT